MWTNAKKEKKKKSNIMAKNCKHVNFPKSEDLTWQQFVFYLEKLGKNFVGGKHSDLMLTMFFSV
jgi:hypothetical protein